MFASLHIPVSIRCASLVAGLALCAAGAASAQSTVVRVTTNVGNIDIQLLDAEAPKTVANYLAYVRSNAWANVLVHRSVPGFVIQTGGYRWTSDTAVVKIPANPAVVNEFSSTRSNIRGTVAMAKLGGNPNSATSEWFVNLSNNSANLDTQNGGFTVFARVSTEGMATADKIAGLPRVNAAPNPPNGVGNSALSEMPVTSSQVRLDNIRSLSVLITSITEFPAQAGKTDSDRIFDFLEKSYPQYVPVEGKESGAALGYVFRYYPKTNSYVGTKDNQVWYLVPAISPDVQRLGTLTDWLVIAATSGS